MAVLRGMSGSPWTPVKVSPRPRQSSLSNPAESPRINAMKLAALTRRRNGSSNPDGQEPLFLLLFREKVGSGLSLNLAFHIL